MKYIIDNNPENPNIKIFDSYLVSDDNEKIKILEEIMNDPLYSEVNRSRTIKSYLKEGKAHNVLYKGGFYKDRTKHVDLDEKGDNVLYAILAGFE